MTKYVVKKFYPNKPRGEAWQVAGYLYAKDNSEAWSEAVASFGKDNLGQVIPVSDWLDD